MKILACWTKLNQILYTHSVGPQNEKINDGRGVKNENSSPLDQTQPNLYTFSVGPQNEKNNDGRGEHITSER